MLQVLETKPMSAKENMQMDQEMLDLLDRSQDPILHFYEWEKDSVTHGYFSKPEELLNLKELVNRNIDIAKRPTGGGVVFHSWDLAFSFLMPSAHPDFSMNTLENYAFVGDLVKTAVDELFDLSETVLIPEDMEGNRYFCMAKPTKYDVVLKGRKIAGAAQRKKRTGYLHQGTISLAKPNEELLSLLLKDGENIQAAMQNFSYQPLDGNWTKNELDDLRYQMKVFLIKHFKQAL